MTADKEPAGELGTGIRRLVRLRIWLGERIRFNEWQITLFWAAVIGLAGAWVSIGFKEATEWLHEVFTGHREGYAESFRRMPEWRRVLVPTIGGLLAGSTMIIGRRYKARSNSSDYMEAVVVGDGNLAIRRSLVKSISAWFSSASGASIGREGPLVALASLAASVFGRALSFPLARRRQIVACGAAAGIAGAYNAPIAGAFFVAEIVLGSMAMESFGPLVVSSVVATLVTRDFYGAEALYAAPVFRLESNLQLFWYLGLGLVTGLLAPAYLKLLKGGEKLFALLRLPAPARLALGGLVVGLLAIRFPETTGNGRGLVFAILHHPGTWQVIAVFLVCKLVATAATFGSGAVGGVFTPTLFTGAALGYLFGVAAGTLAPGFGLEPGAFGLVGMGAFLAAATGAPVMAIIMIFELTLNYQILMPVMLASVVGYYVCRSFGARPLYSAALERKGAALVTRHLESLKVGDLMVASGTALAPDASFGEVARTFLQSRHEILPVVGDGRLLGVVSLHDVKAHLDHPELEALLMASDVMRIDPVRLGPAQTLSEALTKFGESDAGRLPVTGPAGEFLGTLSRADLMMFLAGKPAAASVG